MQHTLHLYFQVASFILAVVFYKYLRQFKISLFAWLLFYVCVTELSAANLEWFGLKSNYFIYNYYLIVTTPAYLWLFLNMLDFKGMVKTIYFIIMGLVMLFVLLDYLFLQGPNMFSTYSLIMVEFVTGVLSLMLITKLFREDNFEVGITNNPYFWIAAGTLIFSVAAIVLLGLQQFIYLKKIQIGGVSIYAVFMPIINVILYSNYCYAFYLCKKLSKRL